MQEKAAMPHLNQMLTFFLSLEFRLGLMVYACALKCNTHI